MWLVTRVAVLAVVCFFLSAAQSAEARVVINEVMWAGSDRSTADEWVELTADTDTDIGDWTLTTQNSKGTEDTMIAFSSGTLVGSGTFFIVSNYDADVSRLAVIPHFTTTKMSLPNTKLRLRLRDAAGVIIDEADDGVGAPFAGQNSPKASMERRDIFSAGTLKENWQSAEQTLGFDEGSLIFGTPGSPNAAAPLPPPEPAPVVAIAPPSQPPCYPYTGTGIIVSEIFPAPAGRDEDFEWIEIASFVPRRIGLCGWKLDDSEKGSRPFPLDEFELSYGQRIAFHRVQTKIALNDSGDAARLLDPFGRVSFERSYGKAMANQAFALREDGLWLWTEVLTPGNTNQFRTADRRFLPGIVSIDAVLPNPAGPDEGHEWMELHNTDSEPMLLNGWKLRTRNGREKTIEHVRLRPGERVRLQGERLPIGIPNTESSVALLDPDGYLVSLLSWDDASDDQVTERAEVTRVQATLRAVQGSRLIVSIRDGEGIAHKETFAVGLEGIDVKNGGVDFLGALMQGQKIELQFDSDNWKQETLRRAVVILENGDSLQALLLRGGVAEVAIKEDSSMRQEEFLFYEREAQEARLGTWADEAHLRSVRTERELQRMAMQIAREGIALTANPDSGMLHSGSGIVITANVPSMLFLSINGGPFAVHSGSLIMSGSLLEIVALAEVLLGYEMKRSDPFHFTFVPVRPRYTEDVRITELFPAPGIRGVSEWIEMKNFSSRPVYFAGWTLDDGPGGSRPWTFDASFVLGPKDHILLPSSLTKLALNDTGDTVRLFAPDGSIVSRLRYSTVKKGQAVALQKSSDQKVTASPLPRRERGRGEGAKKEAFCITDVPTPGVTNFCYTFLPAHTAPDSDHDFLPDDREVYVHHTDPLDPDTDGDLWLDGFEAEQGSDPLEDTHASRSMRSAYRDFVESHVKPKWRLYKKKGLTLTAKKYPLTDITIAMASKEMPLLFDGNDYERVITDPLPRGDQRLPLRLRDITGREVYLASAFPVVLREPYVFVAPKKPKPRKKPSKAKRAETPRGGVSPTVETDEQTDAGILARITAQRVLLAKLFSNEDPNHPARRSPSAEADGEGGNPNPSAPPPQRQKSTVAIIAIVLLWAITAAGLWVWGRRG